MKTASIRKSLEERYWSKIVRHEIGECWGWTGAKNEKGYGVLGKGARGTGSVKAHRVSWEIHFGAIQNGLSVLHHCDNPECTNPAHLFLGTLIDNNSDMKSKGRNVRGECSYSKLTQEQVKEIRERYQPRKVSQYQLAREYGVSRSQIGNIVSWKEWKYAA